MNRNATLRFRRVTALLALAWALLALAFCVAHRLPTRQGLGPPLLIGGLATQPWRITAVTDEARAAGIAPGDRLLAIDGESVERALRDPERLRADHTNRYLVRKARGAGEVEVALHPVAPARLVPTSLSVIQFVLPVIGVVYLLVGVAVWRMRPDRGETWALFLFCCAMGAQLLLPVHPGESPWLAYWLNLPFVGVTTFQLFTSYPSEPPWVVRHAWWARTLPYLLALPIGLLAVLEGALGPRVAIGKPLALWFTIALSVGSLLVAMSERRRLRETKAADRADVMLLGAVVSFLPATISVLAQNWLAAPFPWYMGFASFFVFPVAVGYGIVRRQLFEIRVVAKSSAAYGAVTLAITGVYAFLITFADAVVTRFNVNARSPWFSIAFLFGAILAFNPLRDRMQALVDRLFDRDHALYRRAVREISEAMVSMLSTREVVERILVALTETMGVTRAVVLLQDEARRLAPVASRGEWEEEALGVVLPLDHPLCARLLLRRDALARGDFDDEPDLELRELCRDVFDQLEVELIVPIPYGADLLGAIGVGHKFSGERLGAEDRQLLMTLANQSSIAIQNARAFGEIADLNATLEARVEERTRELHDAQAQLLHSEKMRSLGQLVAGVAHELNNPIGFVHANLQLLQEYSRRLVSAQRAGEDTTKIEAAIEKLLARSREGTERVTKIVQDLRTFSRMDQAGLAEVDLNEEIDRTIALMEARLRDGIELVRDYVPLPRVRCYAGQLNQVFMNLLMNACDALDGKGRILIRTRARADVRGRPLGVRLEFHDDGPGIPPDVQARLFEPFFTTKPVGKGTGLGLSISYGIVERHGGRMLVGSAPGEGTTFVIELPLEAKPVQGSAEEVV